MENLKKPIVVYVLKTINGNLQIEKGERDCGRERVDDTSVSISLIIYCCT